MYAEKLIQFGWGNHITEALKQGGITLMMDHRLFNPAKLRAYALSEQLKEIMAPLKPRNTWMTSSPANSSGMADWANDDKKPLTWRRASVKLAFETAPRFEGKIGEQEYFGIKAC